MLSEASAKSSPGGGPGEYDVTIPLPSLLPIVNNEFLSSKLVIKEVVTASSTAGNRNNGVSDDTGSSSIIISTTTTSSNSENLYQLSSSSERNWIARGHTVVGLNGIYFEKMKKKDFIIALSKVSYPIKIRCRDEKYAALEIKYMKMDSKLSSLKRPIPSDLISMLSISQDWIWNGKCQKTEIVLKQLSLALDPLVSLTLAESSLIRVLVSQDKDYIELALRACETAVNCTHHIAALRSTSSETRYYAEVAAAEALAMQTVVLFFNEQRTSAANVLRKAWKSYKHLHDQFKPLLDKSHPTKAVIGLFHRIQLGIGICSVFSALVPPKLKWILSLIGVKADIPYGLECLRSCYTGHHLMRSRWAAMALINCRSAVRIGSNRTFDALALTQEIESIKANVLKLYPNSPLFLWACSKQSNDAHFGIRNFKEGDFDNTSAACMNRLSSAFKLCKEIDANGKAHLLRADLGWYLFMEAKFSQASLLLESVAHADTAPFKKQLHCAIYYAACLSRNTLSVSTAQQELQRILKRPEAKKSTNSLVHRTIRVYNHRNARHFLLLPFEAIYVHWRDAKLFSASSFDRNTTTRTYDDYALNAIDEIGLKFHLSLSCQNMIYNIVSKKMHADVTSFKSNVVKESNCVVLLAEWMTIRALILRRLHRLQDAARLLAFVIALEEVLPQNSYMVPISLFRLAVDTYERQIGFDPLATSIHLLGRAEKLSGGYDYEPQYATRISSMLRMLQRAASEAKSSAALEASSSQRRNSSKRSVEELVAQVERMQIETVVKRLKTTTTTASAVCV